MRAYVCVCMHARVCVCVCVCKIEHKLELSFPVELFPFHPNLALPLCCFFIFYQVSIELRFGL